MGILNASHLMASDVQERLETFTAGDQSIRGECFKPSKAGRYPAILLLHGDDGLETSGASLLRWVAHDLTRHGYVVHLVHYFDRTGIKRIACADITKKDRETDRLAWLDTACLAIQRLAKSPEVDSKRIGVVGVSLGAYLAVAAAAKEGSSVAAVVELFGGLPPGVRRDVTRMPPVLIIHGTEDQVVKVSEAHKLEDFLHVRHASVTITVYEGIGHVFTSGRQVPDDGCSRRQRAGHPVSRETPLQEGRDRRREVMPKRRPVTLHLLMSFMLRDTVSLRWADDSRRMAFAFLSGGF